ncbi:MAG: Ig-like domain-containing protein [Gammaproteobacteria bacterium]|nr:Ig-like domain-containing protein [Gammaproteobacteria bacterium]
MLSLPARSGVIAALLSLPAMHTAAQPSLSPDGSTLSGVEVDGITYQINFADSRFGDTFLPEQVDQPSWEALANDVSVAVVSALNGLAERPDPTDINGCTSTTECILFLPDEYIEASDLYRDNSFARVTPSGANRSAGSADGGSNASTASVAAFTVMTFAEAGIPPSACPPDGSSIITLEEPVDGAVMGGIGNLRGWAVSNDGVSRVEIFLDGEYAFDAPYGGLREDVADIFPAVNGAENSGFSLAYGYSNLSAGEHTITARAYLDCDGATPVESSATFEVIRFDKDFIAANDTVDTSNATITANGDQISLSEVQIGDSFYALLLEWRTAEQGFEIVRIDKLPD